MNSKKKEEPLKNIYILYLYIYITYIYTYIFFLMLMWIKDKLKEDVISR